MDRGTLVRLFDYHYWARDRLLAALEPLPADVYTRDLGSSFGSIRDTAVHIYGAEWVWHSRWHGVSPTERIEPAAYPDVATLASAWRDLEGRLRQMLTDMADADLTREIDYRLINGAPGRSVFWHMAQHVVNHASYHRGQITTLLRQAGAAPPASTDLIAYYRELSTPATGLI